DRPIVQAFGDSALSYSQVSRWLKEFKEGREEVVDDPHAGRPSTSTTDDNFTRVRDLLNSDRWLSVQMIAETLNIPKTIVHELVTDKLHMRKVRAQAGSQAFNGRSEELRVTVATELLECVKIEPSFLDNVITGGKTLCFEYDPETKRQSCKWHTLGSPKPKKARMSKSKMKTMLIVSFDAKGVVHK
ncbi:putative uncharacterized protein FLJ37770, partial [Orussus abietinus]|uniref:putative uncharacterized protein FLJ37770 n=1 Tax=Orussus abietinus TaxID=222816 RepID=UPI000C715BBB